MSVSFNKSNRSVSQGSASSTRSTKSAGSAVQANAGPSIRSVFLPGQVSSRGSQSDLKSKTPATDYIASSGFMQDLRAKLSATGDDPAQYLRAQSMMDALSSGRLQVSDPTQGKTINAWNPAQKDAKPTAATDIARTNWAEFLNSQLKRNEDGALSKDGSGSYVDKTSGKHAYFGRVAGNYYYVTWPAETKT